MTRFEGGDFKVEHASKRWNFLKECFIKSRRKYLSEVKANSKSGSAATKIVKPTFRYHESMAFLNDVLDYKQ